MAAHSVICTRTPPSIVETWGNYTTLPADHADEEYPPVVSDDAEPSVPVEIPLPPPQESVEQANTTVPDDAVPLVHDEVLNVMPESTPTVLPPQPVVEPAVAAVFQPVVEPAVDEAPQPLPNVLLPQLEAVLFPSIAV